MKTSSCKRFTLIEMLVVIAIISILAGLVFPALGLARQNAKKSKANSECQSLKTAIIMYESEFSCWPAKPGTEGNALNDGDYKTLCRMLTGENGKKMMFYEVGMGYDDTKNMILDPWGNPYEVRIDNLEEMTVSDTLEGVVSFPNAMRHYYEEGVCDPDAEWKWDDYSL